VLQEYGLGFNELMSLPIKRFWFLSNQIERLRAEKDQRQLQLLASVTTQDGFKAANENLKQAIGKVYVWTPKVNTEIRIDPKTGLDPEFDREGLRALKARLAGH
jgi:hypothetical protein